jgi:hypothetical protein
MESRTYTISKIEDSRRSGYLLEGPGLVAERVFRGEESRERLQDIADLMNFAFEQGRQVVAAEQAPSRSVDASSNDVPSMSAEKMPGLEKEGGSLLRGMPRQAES